ncbi:Cof-type HAD-IIB family hydrolase [Bacillus pumilus]|uniref:Cof-type HAD-IIB family hydrolase n=1 Tax=Bacillus pumilus TaxID=1408 RepID=UPI000B43EDBD|nr:Cof-type HAD-IIB family hydrolase [Bacillus pumilus]MBU8639173.1 Cof-type HAD-IIB family hydrolase [Bacillus pumilus]MBU8698492.1 Cof-type HAD-IIB family hydrolase [Bacillus pumilus]MBU8727275.1 Cof-type HAD-IIB family hydrolase [Bacillus pumilus]OUZ06993.1 haloacid dehalogenase [Bacillus pumilus]
MKIIAIDLDGTLLSENLTIQEQDVNALYFGQKQGHIVTIATGRALFDAKHITKKYHLNCPIIASNGAQIYVDNQVLFEQYMNSRLIKPIITWLNKAEFYYQVYLSDKIVVSNQGIQQLEKQLYHTVVEDPQFNQEMFWDSIKAQLVQYGLEEVPNSIPVDYDDVIKFMIVSPSQKNLKEAKEYFGQLNECVVTSSGPFNLEITSAGVDKGSSLNKICEYYKTTTKNAIAIGDNLNDLSMFNVAGTGIAMGNADKALSKVATFKTLSNHECGVAYAFNHYILNKNDAPKPWSTQS